MTTHPVTLAEAREDHSWAWRRILIRIKQLSREYGGELMPLCAAIHREGPAHELRVLCVDRDEMTEIWRGERTTTAFSIWVHHMTGAN